MTPFQYPNVDGRKRSRRLLDPKASSTSAGSVLKMRKACNPCREKKIRCSGQEPCARCQRNGHVCVYTPTAPASRHLARQLPDTARNPTGVLSPTYTAISADSQSDLVTRQPLLDTRGECGPVRLDESAPDTLLQEDQYGHVHGGASDFAFLNLAKQKLANMPSMPIDFCDYPLTPSGGPGVMPPKKIADELIHTYFNFGLSTSRFVHQPSLVSDYEKLYDPTTCADIPPEKLALIFMVLAWGSHYSLVRNVWCGYSASIVQFYEMAENQRQKGGHDTSFTSLQTELLVALYLLNHSRMHQAWSLFGVVVRHAQALGLHRRSSGAVPDCIMHEYRKRLLWCIFIHDKVLSSIFGRPCALYIFDIDQEECALANDEDITTSTCHLTPQNTFCSAAGLVQYARLAKILGQILRQIYGPEGRDLTIQSLYQVASDIEAKLTAWQDSLPTYLNYRQLPLSALSTIAQRQTSTLKLTHAHAILLLYRPFILFALGPKRDIISTQQNGWLRDFHNKSIEAANTIVDECKDLAIRGLFTREFTMVNYLQFAATGTLFMYCYLWPEASKVRRTAEEAKAAFPVGVEGDAVGQRYVRVLNELSKLISRDAGMEIDGNTESMDGTHIPDPAIDLGDVPLDLAGPWSNLFFDPTALGDMVTSDGPILRYT